MEYRVYLAGQMAPDRRTVEWRQQFTEAVADLDNVIIEDPSLNEAFKPETTGSKAIDAANASYKGKLILTKDRDMVEECNVIVANLNHYDKEKIILGTLFELAWAFDDPTKTVIVVGDPILAGAAVRHPFVVNSANIVVPTVEEAIQMFRWMAGDPYDRNYSD